MCSVRVVHAVHALGNLKYLKTCGIKGMYAVLN